MYLFGLSQWIVDDVHVEFNFLVDIVPVIYNRALVRAQSNHHPYWQLMQRSQSSYGGVIAREVEGIRNMSVRQEVG